MPYNIHYAMLTGKSVREVFSAIEAVLEYRALQQAGASQMAILDSGGGNVSLADLLASASHEATIPVVGRARGGKASRPSLAPRR